MTHDRQERLRCQKTERPRGQKTIQLSRWRNQSPTPAQATEIARLEQRLAALRTAINELLVLAQQIRPYTIDVILAKSDIELGLDVLLGKLRLLR